MPDETNEGQSHEASWSTKEISLQDVTSKIPNGSAVYVASTAATPDATLRAMVNDLMMENIQIIQMIPGGNLPHLSENLDRFRTSSFFSFTTGGYFKSDENVSKEGLEDYTPISTATIPRLLKENKLHVDVAIIKVSKPHKRFCSLGMGVESTKDFIQHARIVIAEVNKYMPWTDGPSKINISDIDWWIPNDEPLLTTEELWPQLLEKLKHPPDVLKKLGNNVIKEIPDKATLKFGVTPLVFAVFPFLHQRKDLGLHTDILTDPLFRLHELGVINNKYKTIDVGRTVVAQAHGSQELYDFIDRNPSIEFHPSNYVCDPQVLAKIDNLIAIVGALKIDLTGQVATDSIAHKFYGGVMSDQDSIRGAQFSKGGKPIVVLPSKSIHGRSNVVSALPPGTGVAITRADVEYVVTEYGTAYLYGKSIRQRCLALIDIAHPDFRHELLLQAKKHHYISQSQPGKSLESAYPAELECFFTTNSKKNVLVRPIKAVDDDNLRTFFHKLSDHSVYFRYFRRLRSMPQRIIQKTADVDYSSDMAIVALSPPNAYHHELVGIAQWVSDSSTQNCTAPEIAFQVRDDWQGEGLGTFLFKRLLEIARKLGIRKCKADVLAENKSMRKVFAKAGVPFVIAQDFGVITYTFNLDENEAVK